MVTSGLEKVMSCEFAGAPKMFMEKRLPINILALRFTVLKLYVILLKGWLNMRSNYVFEKYYKKKLPGGTLG